MKNICIVGTAVAIAACSSHPVRCRGALQPINQPAATGPASTNSDRAITTGPASTDTDRATTTVPAATNPAAGSNSPAAPREPQL